jgi:putative transposase
MHGIITLVGASLADAPDIGQPQGLPLPVADDKNRAGVTAPTTTATVGDIVGAYKSLVANACLEIYKSKNVGMGKLWQRNYYEHIIRNERSYQNISNYIINNPAKWDEDKFYSI